MGVSAEDRQLIDRVTAAMNAGPAGQEEMLSLFTEDAVLVEPFGGAPRTSSGMPEIRRRYTEMMSEPRPPDFLLNLDRVDTDGATILTDWTCTSVVLPAPMKGQSRYYVRGGKIQRLEISLAGMPPS